MSLKNEKEAISDDQLDQISGGSAADWKPVVNNSSELCVNVFDSSGMPVMHQQFIRQKNGKYSQTTADYSFEGDYIREGEEIDADFVASILDAYSDYDLCSITGKYGKKREEATFKQMKK